MRVNVYAEEITDRVEIVKTTADTGSEFVGIRFYLAGSEALHKHPDDDDSSAVTFWIKSSRGGYKGGDEQQMKHLLGKAQQLIEDLFSEWVKTSRVLR